MEYFDSVEKGERFQQLGLAALSLEDAAYVAGLFEIAAPVELTLRGAKYTLPIPGESGDAAKAAKIEEQALASLVANATPSKFGRKTETLFDPTVRKASEYVADDYTVSGLDIDRMLSYVHLGLFPLANAIHAEPYKLNVMTTNGFFTAHADTPRELPTFGLPIGTLVVCLPTLFSGGVFRLSHGRDNAVELEWCQEIKGQLYHYCGGPAKSVVQYAAFYGDVEHEIKTVTSGHRLTLTYVLYHDQGIPILKDVSTDPRAPAPPQPQATRSDSCAGQGASVPGCDSLPSTAGTPVQVQLAKASRFRDLLVECLKAPDFLSWGGALGFACMHLYEQAHLPPSSLLHPRISQKDLLLKGMDSLVCIAASSLGLRVHFIPAISESFGGRLLVGRMPLKGDSRDFAMPEYESTKCSERTTPAVIASVLGKPPVEMKRVRWCTQLPSSLERNCDTLDPTRHVPLAEYSSMWFSYTGDFGNDGSKTTLYTHVVMVVLVPSIDKRVPGAVVPPIPPPPPSMPPWEIKNEKNKNTSWDFVPSLPPNWDTNVPLTADQVETTDGAVATTP